MIQENQYVFPYHYLTVNEGTDFTQSKTITWGLIHESYLRFLVNKIKSLDPKKLLDAGCGDGRILFELERRTPGTDLVGTDISEHALKFARAFTNNSQLRVHDISKHPVDGDFDLCTSIEVIEHIPPELISDYVINIAKSVKIGGTLILTTPTTNIPTSEKHYQHFTLDMLKDYLSGYFEITEVQYQNVRNLRSNFLQRLLANKYYTLNYQPLKNLIFDFYCKNFFQGDLNNGSRICIIAKRTV